MQRPSLSIIETSLSTCREVCCILKEMYNDIYTYNDKVEISLVQILSIALIVIIAFILPVELITYSSQTQPPVYSASQLATRSTSSQPTLLSGDTLGRVAGASTTVEQTEGRILGADIGTESGRLTLAGIGLLIVSVAATGFLIFSNLHVAKQVTPKRTLEDLDF